MIYIAAVTYWDHDTESEGVALFGTYGFTLRSSDAPASAEVLDRVKNPALIRRDIFEPGTTGGASRVSVGELVLANEDGELDWLNGVALDGRSLVVRVADSLSAAYPAGYTVLFSGTMEQAEVALDEVRIKMRDRRVYADAVFQPATFGGTNTLPNGVDGIESDLKGKPLPRTLGAPFNVEPVCVNTSRLIYQVNSGTIRDVRAVYDSGALLEMDLTEAGERQDYTSQADMEANEPAEGKYRVWLAGGMFRLGSSPAGQLTCDPITGNAPNERDAAYLFQAVAESAGEAPPVVNAADLVALRADNRATLGLYVREATTAGAVLDDIARSVGAWWGDSVSGELRVQRLEAPSGSPVLACTADNIVDGSLKRVPLAEKGLPVHKVTVRGVPNYTVQTSGLVGVVGAARRARLAQPFQDAVASDDTIKDAYLLSPELVVDTKLSCRGDCETEAERLLALFSQKWDRFELVVKGDLATLAAIDLGVVISITYNRFALDAGKLYRVIGYQLLPTEHAIALTVWGGVDV